MSETSPRDTVLSRSILRPSHDIAALLVRKSVASWRAFLPPGNWRLPSLSARSFPIGARVCVSMTSNASIQWLRSASSASRRAFGPAYSPCWNRAQYLCGGACAANAAWSAAVFSSPLGRLVVALVVQPHCRFHVKDAPRLSCRFIALWITFAT